MVWGIICGRKLRVSRRGYSRRDMRSPRPHRPPHRRLEGPDRTEVSACHFVTCHPVYYLPNFCITTVGWRRICETRGHIQSVLTVTLDANGRKGAGQHKETTKKIWHHPKIPHAFVQASERSKQVKSCKVLLQSFSLQLSHRHCRHFHHLHLHGVC